VAKVCINHNNIWLVVLPTGLLLLMSRMGVGFTGQCGICHGPGFAMPTFHDADHLICNKCHTMHASEDGVLPTMPGDSDPMAGPNPHLLYKAEVTDLCLVCHGGDLNSTGAPIVLTVDGTMGGVNYPRLPGGDFYYPKNDSHNGHSPGGTVIGSDSILTQSPGGVFSSADEICTSCHDPHGGSPANDYRLLKLKPGDWTGADLEVTGLEAHPGSDEGSSGGSQPGHSISNTIPGYYSGFSAWCGACHGVFHGSELTDPDVGNNTDWLRHPTDRILDTEIAGNYSPTSTYDWEYPIEDVNSNEIVDSTDEVFCLSCHRAHGTPYSNSTRWYNDAPSGSGTGCSKCHAKG